MQKRRERQRAIQRDGERKGRSQKERDRQED